MKLFSLVFSIYSNVYILCAITLTQALISDDAFGDVYYIVSKHELNFTKIFLTLKQKKGKHRGQSFQMRALNVKGCMHKKNFFCTFDVTLACDDDN